MDFIFSQNYFAHNLKRGNFLTFFFFFFLKQECIVFSPLEEKLYFHFTKSVTKEHRRTAILHIYIFFGIFLHYFFLKKKKECWKDLKESAEI